jgi:hypothetical protein
LTWSSSPAVITVLHSPHRCDAFSRASCAAPARIAVAGASPAACAGRFFGGAARSSGVAIIGALHVSRKPIAIVPSTIAIVPMIVVTAAPGRA